MMNQRVQQVLFLKGKIPVLVVDLSCLLLLYKFAPSVWSNIESVIWYYDCLLYTSVTLELNENWNADVTVFIEILDKNNFA